MINPWLPGCIATCLPACSPRVLLRCGWLCLDPELLALSLPMRVPPCTPRLYDIAVAHS